MSAYPSLRVSNDTLDQSWRDIPLLDSYFLETHPGNWHPEDYGRNTAHRDLTPFFHSLSIISRCHHAASVSAYARDILRYLLTEDGVELKKKVLEKLKLRKLEHSNQLSYSRLKIQYATENYIIRETNRKRSFDVDGSSSASSTSTQVELDQGRRSRRRTPSLPSSSERSTSPTVKETTPASELSSFGQPRPRISDPWHGLVQSALLLYEGEAAELPSEHCGAEEQDPEKKVLCKLALRHLQNAEAEMQQPTFDRTTCTDFKDTFVALSGVWNVFSAQANQAFRSSDRQEVEKLCEIAELRKKDDDIVEILNILADKSRKGPLTKVADELYILLSTKPQHRQLLMFLLAILRYIVRPHHGSMAPSEADSMFLWACIFNDGMPLNTPFSFHLGQEGCAATTLSKSKLAMVFDTGTTTRKCDFLFTVKDLEVGYVEAKRSTASKIEVASQLRKNIKINKSILLELEKYGVDCPPLLSIHGNTAIVFCVRRWKGIFVASKACPILVLPTTEEEWPFFLTQHAHVLYNLLDYYHNFSKRCAASYSFVQYEQQAAAEDELVSLSKEERPTLPE
ncbi:hypothetical protein EMPS_02433 [Entomortierella parvispora]|uniref:Uncharacterized protein n=1 Tax=Entomortierella parvispora TaxID=205924 RepID=A0A9P3H4V5_9FUNG|nr:hypothetical protein EMPS_02433 [Entomortierella parvispora]